MDLLQELVKALPDIEKKLGHSFNNRSLLILAFVHCSFVNENREITAHNERLEFLGDSILGMIISEHVYKEFPSVSEGVLSSMRSRLVEASSCISYLLKLGISKYLLLGRGERLNDGRGRDSLLANLFEAIVGAIYLDAGIDAARRFILTTFHDEITANLHRPIENWKALLQEYAQKNFHTSPRYQVLEAVGPDHDKEFTIAVYINDLEMGKGCGSSKKEAQQAAAEDAYLRVAPERQ